MLKELFNPSLGLVLIHTKNLSDGGKETKLEIRPSKKGAITGATIGMGVGSIVGPIGSIVGATVGGAIGGIFGPED